MLALVACAGTPVKNTQLDLARDTLERVSADPEVARYSKDELNIASASFASAEKAWLAKAETAEVEHLSYIALSDAEIAQTLASVRSSEEQIAKLQLSKREAVADLGTAEVAAAQSEVLRAQSEVLRARGEAASLAAEAEQLKQEAAVRERELKAQLDELNELKALQAKSTDRGMVLTLGDLLFDVGKSTLKEGAISNIDEIAAFMLKHQDRTVVIEGHTDNTGEEDFNRELSLNRATVIGGALEVRGVDFNRITTTGLGEDVPIASNDTAVGRQLNRRVEIIFSNNEEASLTADDSAAIE